MYFKTRRSISMDNNNKKSVLTVGDVAGVLGLSLQGTYDAIGRGDIPHVRIGRKILIPSDAFDKWLQNPSGPATQTLLQELD